MAEWSVNASWEVPPQSWLNISDCNAISPWIAHIFVIASGTASSDASGHDDIPVRIIVDFLRSLVPSNWTQPADGDLLLWYLDFFDYIDGDRLQGIGMFSLQNCGPKVCPNLGFSGDSDLSGIGVSPFHPQTVSYVLAVMGSNAKQMMISYYMVAIFATLYYLAIAPGILETYSGSLGSSQWAARYRKVASGFEGSVTAFLDAMLLFSISMLVAAVTRYSALILHPEEIHFLFGLQNCVFLSAFAVFPAFLLQSVSRDLRRRRVRLFLWDLVFVFALVVEILYRLEYRSTVEDLAAIDSSTGSELSQIAWFSNCQSESLRQALQTLLSVGHGIMLANCAWWLYNLADIYLGRWWKPALQQRPRMWDIWARFRLWLRISNGLICLVVMWAFLGLFTAYRHDVLTKAGSANEDNEWTFGQVLSLTTWIPIGIELLAVYICECLFQLPRWINHIYPFT